MKNYYEILEVNQKASIEVIEKAYRVLVKKYHPDKYSTNDKKIYESKIRDINEAYKILSDEFLKVQYDNELKKELQDEYSNDDPISRYGHRFKRIRENQPANKKEKELKVKSDLGTFKGVVGVAKLVFENRPDLKKIKDLKREDYIALALTTVVVTVVGIVLWFIPATNGFMRSILPFV